MVFSGFLGFLYILGIAFIYDAGFTPPPSTVFRLEIIS